MYTKAKLYTGGIVVAMVLFTSAFFTSNIGTLANAQMMMDNSSDKHMGKMMMAMKMSPLMCMDPHEMMSMMMGKSMMRKGDNMSMGMKGENMSMMMDNWMKGDNMSMMDKPMMKMVCMDVHDVMMMKMMKHMKSGENMSDMMMMGNRSMMWEK